MNNDINLTAVLCTDTIGVLLSFLMLISNSWRIRDKSKESKYVFYMIISVLFSCIFDPVLFILDGYSGDAARVVLFLGNTWLYFSDILIGSFWVIFLLIRLYGEIPQRHLLFIKVILALSVLMLTVNFIFPIVFYINEYNQYVRNPGSYWFFGIFVFYIFECVVAYFYVQQKSGSLRFFTIWAFVIPVLLGIVIQINCYGISMIWPCAAVALSSMIMSLQNIQMFQDKLTGLYNRCYLDNIQNKFGLGSQRKFCIIMLDLNGFKEINDRFGHYTGDVALIEMSAILKRVAGYKGIAIRYAGDEFIIIINSSRLEDGHKCIGRINQLLDEFNSSHKVPFVLSAAIGCCMADMSCDSMESILHKVDIEMYNSKSQYYQKYGKR